MTYLSNWYKKRTLHRSDSMLLLQVIAREIYFPTLLLDSTITMPIILEGVDSLFYVTLLHEVSAL